MCSSMIFKALTTSIRSVFGMTAFIFVTSARYAVLAQSDGSFELSDVPAGEYTLKVWSVEATARSEQVIVRRDGEGTEVTLH